MSSEAPLIRIEGLSKCYQIYDHPRDRLKQFVLPRVRRRLGLEAHRYFREFWALRDFSLSIAKGETVGIIGRNGSGKSTLLQVICGTVSPTTGSVETNGRVAALLELGAGFNPEFTGRENVFLNGSVFGLSSDEVERKFDDITSFADIGEFIDQPVKTYSSGMLVRLAFAVAISVEPVVLIVDEALSVGDFAFQNKCIQRLRQMRNAGVTLLFVSHDLNVVQTLCDRVVWLEKGAICAQGEPAKVCQEYQAAMLGESAVIAPAARDFISQQDTGLARYVDLRIADVPSNADRTFMLGDSIRFAFTIEALAPLDEVVFTISVYRTDGDWVLGLTSRDSDTRWEAIPAGARVAGRLSLQPLYLAPGDYIAAFSACSADLALTYALTDLVLPFSVRASRPTWGRFDHPAVWARLDAASHDLH